MPNRRFLCWNVTLFMTFVSYGYICECKNEHNDSVRSFIVFAFCAVIGNAPISSSATIKF